MDDLGSAAKTAPQALKREERPALPKEPPRNFDQDTETWQVEERGMAESCLTCPFVSINTAPSPRRQPTWFILSKGRSYSVGQRAVRNGNLVSVTFFSSDSLPYPTAEWYVWGGWCWVLPHEVPNLFPDLSVLYFSGAHLPFWPGCFTARTYWSGLAGL